MTDHTWDGIQIFDTQEEADEYDRWYAAEMNRRLEALGLEDRIKTNQEYREERGD